MCKYLLYCLCAIVFVACTDDDTNSLSDSTATSIVGRWYEEHANNYSGIDVSEVLYTGDGLEYWNVYMYQGYLYKPYQTSGTYSVSGNRLTESYVIFNRSMGFALDVRMHSELTMETTDELYGTFVYYRIVGERELNLGETKNLDVEDLLKEYCPSDVAVFNYSVTDESVATVDESGNVTAKLIGKTWVKVSTSRGTAVVKVSVYDSGHLWNDYTPALYMSTDEIAQTFGKFYASKTQDTIWYNVDNFYVDKVWMFTDEEKASWVYLDMTDKAVPEDVLEYINGKYLFLDVESDEYGNYYIFRNSEKETVKSFQIVYHPGRKVLYYYTISNDGWEDYTDLYGFTQKQLVSYYGTPGASSVNAVAYRIKDSFISSVAFIFYGGIMSRYRLTLSENADSNDIYEYMLKNYTLIEKNDLYSIFLKTKTIRNHRLSVTVYYMDGKYVDVYMSKEDDL